ncbi:hypothetical protein MBM_03465 [Drepanopeziza brunnea f. sp. 'multigermtubi' MB_m1]|uniref:Uncharacterized protein n=1 Tax=Marssonina brunnea f. sp. multigermtubi (strain MB_m1) TaxID=1072389 RepID=K1X0F8_MARBU|nr:uncharacterized protein MBM_03465 [Drepanopeziza brunnea f. sp. 'multigermtubi' MB_m1]EKD18472.1 hypothetical protein MBM_03465 [Drepanopeziza brunnea f. sp. 'multigermtubi' MB_m1]
MASSQGHKSVSNVPLYASCITNIKHKARIWRIAGYSFDLEYSKIDSLIRNCGEYGEYSETEKLWHVELYIWSHYCTSLNNPLPPRACLAPSSKTRTQHTRLRRMQLTDPSPVPNEPFPFPCPTSSGQAMLVSDANPAPPEPTSHPRPTDISPFPAVFNPYPPVYMPGARSPEPEPATSRASLPSQSSSSSASFRIRGSSSATHNFGTQGAAASSMSNRHHSPLPAKVSADVAIGRAYNNRPTRGRRGGGGPYLSGTSPGQPTSQESSIRRLSLESRMGPIGGGSGTNGGHGQVGNGEKKKTGRKAVQAVRRQLKIARRTGGRNKGMGLGRPNAVG